MRKPLVKRYSYGEHDYPFGQTMLTLRSRIGLTQAGLAALLRVSRRAVGEWEGGLSYPTAEHLQHFIELGAQQHVFAPSGRKRRSAPYGKWLINGFSLMKPGSQL